jgi:[CysO sulfur-carrier protein]-S-L-cysteine hydrolase
LKLLNIDTGLKLTVDDQLLEFIYRTGLEKYPKEFGGFLFGYYENDFKTLNITDTILPIVFTSTRNSFERQTLGIEREFEVFYNQTPSKYYVGEWHTHPDGSATPSRRDLIAIKSILTYPKVVIKSPVFLIVGLTHSTKELGFYAPLKNKIYKYEQQD